MKSRFHHLSRIVPAWGLVLALAGGVLTGGPMAAALAPRTVTMIQLASATYPGMAFGEMVRDEAHDRGYALDFVAGTLDIFDVSGSGIRLLGSIGPIEGAARIALSESTAEVVVAGGLTSGVLNVVDIDPASPSVNTIVATIPTGPSRSASFVKVNRAGVAYVGDRSSNVAVVDLKTRGVKNVTVRTGLNDLAVDERSGAAYTANFYDNSISTLLPDGTFTTASIAPDYPRSIEVANGVAIVGISTPDSRNEVISVDPHTGVRTATSADFPSLLEGLEVDADLGLLYIAASKVGDPAVRALRLGTLEPQFTSSAAAGSSYIGVDRATHQLSVSQGPGAISVNRIDVTPQRGVERIGGADRFEVSASVSADSFAPGVPVAYLASGLGFADALSGSAAAGADSGPVLLTGKESVPGVVLRELIRLKPQRIVVLGGAASISESVIDTVSAVASTTRIAGADRFDVSAGVSAATFDPGLPVAYVASGTVFADALSGSAAAGSRGAPVLLTLKDSVPASVGDELRRLHPGAIVVLGGVNSVSDGVMGSLGSIAPTTRIAGADRFDVSAAVSAATFRDGSRTVYVASGAVFPDALSGSAAAIENLAPVLLTTRDAVPSAVLAEIDRLKPARIVLLGGPNSVSDAVKTTLAGYLAP